MIIQLFDKPEFPLMERISAEYLNKWFSLRRIIARRIRYVKHKFRSQAPLTTFITPAEYVEAEEYIFAYIQAEAFTDDYNALMHGECLSSDSPLHGMSPCIPKKGVIRMHSRLGNAESSYLNKSPAILPNSHPLVDAFIRQYHVDYQHHGENSVIAAIRRKA